MAMFKKMAILVGIMSHIHGTWMDVYGQVGTVHEWNNPSVIKPSELNTLYKRRLQLEFHLFWKGIFQCHGLWNGDGIQRWIYALFFFDRPIYVPPGKEIDLYLMTRVGSGGKYRRQTVEQTFLSVEWSFKHVERLSISVDSGSQNRLKIGLTTSRLDTNQCIAIAPRNWILACFGRLG